MKKLLALSLIIPLLTGCASFSFGKPKVQPVEIQTTAVERTRLNLPHPTPLSPRTPQWIVITPENAEQVWKDLESKNSNLVLFAITDKGYEELSVTMAEIRNFINSQRHIIIKYKEYYEPVDTE
jgi:hypothetical protein